LKRALQGRNVFNHADSGESVMTATSRFAAILASTSLCLAAPGVLADGGGGGGNTMNNSFPSSSAPRYDVNVEYKKGAEALQAGNYQEADQAFGHVLRMVPQDANTHYLDGLAEVGLGKLKDARKHFEKAVKYNDNLILAHQELAVTLAKLGETDKARAILDNLKQRAATCADTCAQAADLHAAIPAIETALGGAQPTSMFTVPDEFMFASAAKGDRAYLDAVALINEKRYEEAIVALNASARAFGPHPDILTYLGFANRKLHRYDIAENYYRQALAAAPNHLGATEYYGELMVERGDLAGARRMLAKLENVCSFGCAQADELRRWIVAAKPDAS
jgi:tetratricopeptide (TPR) repeat protein